MMFLRKKNGYARICWDMLVYAIFNKKYFEDGAD